MPSRKGFDLEVSTVIKVLGFVLVGLILAGFMTSDFIKGNIFSLTESITFGERELDHKERIFPKGEEWGGIIFEVDHKAIDDIVGGNEIAIESRIDNEMNISVDLRVRLEDENDNHITTWPSSGSYRELRPTRTWIETYDTSWDPLKDRSHVDDGYNVTLRMDGYGLIGFYNATADEVPDPRGCMVCV